MPNPSPRLAMAAAAREAAFTQRHRICGAMPVHQRLLELTPQFRERQHQLEHACQERRRVARARVAAAESGPITIQTIVHVVFNSDAEKATNAQIQAQIAVLNADYGATNADKTKVPDPWKGLVIDSGIRFALSDVKFVETNATSFGDDDAVKFSSSGGSDIVDPARFLNIWVCNLQPWLGYAQFPGGAPETDGVVILHSAFGIGGTARAPFDKGRTATHEVGHWLNLRHIWGDTEDCSGSDFVDDTPNAAGPNYNTPTFPSISCNNGPHGDMFMNYMDYVDDAAMVMFTAQQVARMSATLEGPRAALVGAAQT